MKTFLESAIDEIYSKENDFIVLGLTGRTGSGCSTLARVLTSSKSDIQHSLYSGSTPSNNAQRKERIIKNHFDSEWSPFTLIQVRSLITLEIATDDLPASKTKAVRKACEVSDSKFENFLSIRKEIKEKSEEVDSDKNPEKVIDFYCHWLPNKCNELKSSLGESHFVQLYQWVGENLRKSGKPFIEKQEHNKSFTLAEKINELIKRIKNANKELNKSTFIVIDAIRNPLEALYFQDRYAAFYLVAISSPDHQRKSRLRKQGYHDDEIVQIDSQENESKDISKHSAYSAQDIKSCLERADIYIDNPDQENVVSEFSNLSNQIIKFVSLMQRPGLVTPSPVERCMQVAYTAKLNSGCISRQVGAVVTDSNYSIKSIGWNDVPHNQVPCNLRDRCDLINGNDICAYSQYEKNEKAFIDQIKESNKKYRKIQDRALPYCFKSEYNDIVGHKNQVHTRSLHAEENAFLQISKYGGTGVKGGYLFTTASPCELCSKKAYQLGIDKIFYIDPYPGIAINHILKGGNREVELNLFSGAIGRAFHRLYMPIAAHKDELSALASMD